MINDLALTKSEIQSYFASRAGESRGNRYRCPIHNGEEFNLSVELDTGRWFCHSSCKRGGSIFDLEMTLEGLEFKRAKGQVFDIVGRDVKTQVVKYWVYSDEKGNPLYRVKRTDGGSDGRQFRQERWDGHRFDPTPGNMKTARLVPYNLPAVLSSQTVYIVEGEKCADLLIQHGLVATTNSGGSGKWRKEINDAFRGKDIVFVPDLDDEGRRHCKSVVEMLYPIAASITVVELPDLNSDKEDVYDWFQFHGHTITEFEALVERSDKLGPYTSKALEIAQPKSPARAGHPDTRELIFTFTGKGHANDIAYQVLNKHFFMASGDFLWRYNNIHWELTGKNFIKSEALNYDSETSTDTRRNEVYSYIRDFCYREEIQWRNIGRHEVPFHNGVLDLESGELRPHRYHDYLETVIPHDYVREGESKVWDRILNDYFGDDRECSAKIAALQEFFGYCLMQHARYKKALVLKGDTDTGKSVVLDTIKKLVGAQNSCSVAVEHMDDQMKRAPLMGKLVNSISELTSSSLIADGGFKTLVSTEEPITIEQKFKDPISYVPIAKHVIATNNLPRVSDKSRATFNRLLLIKFNKSIPTAKQDRGIWDKIASEFPGIVAWTVEGARRLYKNDGVFTSIQESVDIVESYRRSQNPIMEFLEDACVKQPAAEKEDAAFRIPRVEFTERFARYVNDKVTATQIGHYLMSINVTIKKGRCYDGQNTQAIVGYRWKSSGDRKAENEAEE